MRKSICDSVMVSFAIALYFAVILPVQSYLPNADAFGYSLGTLLRELSLYSMAVWAGLLFLLLASSFFCGRLIHVFLLAVFCISVFESGFFAIGLPTLDGDFSGYQRPGRMIWDTVGILLIFVLPFCFYSVVKKHLASTAFALALLAGASLLDIKGSLEHVSKIGGERFGSLQSRQDVVESVEYSTNRNVVVLILDSISAEAASDILRADENLAKRFPGFINYVDNIGMQWMTSLAIPAMFTGDFVDDISQLRMYEDSHWTKKSAFYRYAQNDVATFINLDMGPGTGFTNRLKDSAKLKSGSKMDSSAVSKAMCGLFPFTVIQLSIFRTVPYVLKRLTVPLSAQIESEIAQKNTDGVGDLSMDRCIWDKLAKARICEDCGLTLQVHHSRGGHLPVIFDGNGNRKKVINPSYSDYLGQCKFAMCCVADLFDRWRENGVYDASTIFLLADHATYISKHKSSRELPAQAFPFLMVKARMATERYCESKVQTSHGGLTQCLRRMCKQDLPAEEIEKELFGERRCCRRPDFNGRIQQWVVDTNGIVTTSIISGENKNRVLEPVRENSEYTFVANDYTHPYPDFTLENGNRQGWDGIIFAGKNPMIIRMRMPLENETYVIKLVARVGSDGASVCCGEEDCSLKKGKRSESAIRVVADEHGYVQLRFNSERPAYDCISVRSMVVHRVSPDT